MRKVWNDSSFHFVHNSWDSMSYLKNLVFPKELFAIYHRDKDLYEFIYLPLKCKEQLAFSYYYQGKEFHLYYDKPSKEFEKLALHVKTDDIPVNYDRVLGLMSYSQFYNSKSASQMPTNFFIKGDFKDLPYIEHLQFFKHVNFLMTFYRRDSPTILLFDTSDVSECDVKRPCKSNHSTFPQVIRTRKYDSTLLDLLEAARSSQNNRLAYIFYYQVLEYCSYYYLENDVRKQVENVVLAPDVLNSNQYAHRVLEILSDYTKNKTDAQRLDKLIVDHCELNDIIDELRDNIDYFSHDIQFDGGFVTKALFNKPEDINNPSKDLFTSIRKGIDSIRNVLVHARESRENVIISPTLRNAALLKPYLYLVRRIAEVVVIKFDNE